MKEKRYITMNADLATHARLKRLARASRESLVETLRHAAMHLERALIRRESQAAERCPRPRRKGVRR